MPPALTPLPRLTLVLPLILQGSCYHCRGPKRNEVLIPVTLTYFIPISIESTGIFGPRTESFVKDLGRRITRQSKATTYLRQRLLAAIHCGNALSVLGTCNSLLFSFFVLFCFFVFLFVCCVCLLWFLHVFFLCLTPQCYFYYDSNQLL